MSRYARRAGLLLGLAALSSRAAAQDSAAAKVAFARITYLTGASAYLDAGSRDGLSEGARVDVVRSGATIGVLKVAFLASHQASCDIVSSAAAFAVGDSVRFTPAAAPRDSSVAARPPGAPPPAPRPGASASRLRGRIGAEYLTVGSLGGGVGGFSQPSLDLRLDGHPLGAPALALAVDVRARHTYTILADGTAIDDGRNRVYQAALSLNAPGSPARVTLGRQLSGNLASIGVFDGLLVELNQPGWSSGAFGGTQPEPLQLDFSTDITQFGAYVQRHSAPGAGAHWAVTLGASDSYDLGQANREFAYVQGSYMSGRVSALLTQEVDYYRSWKLMPGMDAVSPTSTFTLLRYRPVGGLTLDAGFDNRRNVRLYRDVVNPATAFDDAFRQGAWAGVSLAFGPRYRIGVDARSSSGGGAGHANAYTLSLNADRVTRLGLTLRTRTTRYTGPDLDGWLHSLALGLYPAGWLRLELNGGVRQEMNPLADPVAKVWATWIGGDLDVDLARSWFLMLTGTRETGGFEGNDQFYGGVSFRF